MLENLFTISRITNCDNAYQYKAIIDAESNILKGHFVEQPVVPGVCTMEMIKSCLSDIFDRKSVSYASVKECKFLAAIIPNDVEHLIVNIELKSEGNINVVVLNGDSIMMKLKAVIA